MSSSPIVLFMDNVIRYHLALEFMIIVGRTNIVNYVMIEIVS